MILITRESVHMWEQKLYGKISVPSSQFYCKPKTALKSKVLKKKEAYTIKVVRLSAC